MDTRSWWGSLVALVHHQVGDKVTATDSVAHGCLHGRGSPSVLTLDQVLELGCQDREGGLKDVGLHDVLQLPCEASYIRL